MSLRALTKNRLAFAGCVLVALVAGSAVLGPVLSSQDPLAMDLGARLSRPSADNPLGTDQFGRDLLARILHGARISVKVGLISVAIGLGLGLPLGAGAAYLGGAVDQIAMRVMDAVLSEREKEYVIAAQALGKPGLRILGREILPNCWAPLLVQSSANFAQAIIIESSLSFIGVGTPPPTPSWGTMLFEARGFLERAPLVAVFPGLAICLSVLGFNLAGDGLRDLLDPRLRSELGRSASGAMALAPTRSAR